LATSPADVAILASYFGATLLLGFWLGRRQRDVSDYMVGRRDVPWWAVLLSIVATETSALTFLSVPGDAYRTGFAFLQLTFGYLVGRIVVSFVLLPHYFKGDLSTAYALLEQRFGVATRRFASLIFMVTRVMAANFILAAFLGGAGGALAIMALGHIEPTFSYWTTSGEFVFVAILGGWQSVAAVFVASTLLEVVRSFSSAYFPNTWQLALGLFLLFVIRFLPRGIGSLWIRGGRR